MINKFDVFLEKTAEDVMVPRSDTITVSCDINLEELCKVIISQDHTRTFIYRETIDNILEFIHIKDLFKIVVYHHKYSLLKLVRKHIICLY